MLEDTAEFGVDSLWGGRGFANDDGGTLLLLVLLLLFDDEEEDNVVREGFDDIF